MRILLANYRYFVSGGPERYMFAIEEALADKGHQIIPFSVRYRQNRPSPFEAYFVPPLAGDDEVRLAEHRWTLRSAWKTVERAFYSPEVEKAVGQLVHDTRPQVALVLHFLRKLSPALLVGLKRAGIPVLVRISDVQLLCPESHFLRDGQPCTLCLHGALMPSVRYRCVKGSWAGSLLNALAVHYHRFRRYLDLVDYFIVPSRHTLALFEEAGWPKERFVHLPTFVHPSLLAAPAASAANSPRRHFLYVGHLANHKGVDVLLQAYAAYRKGAASTVPPLVLVGSAPESIQARYMALAGDLGLSTHVQFRGFLEGDELADCYRDALCTVVPSLCYENMPNVVLESLACGTPVLASHHGSLPELIQDGRTGRLFSPGNHTALADMLRETAADPSWCEQAGQRGRAFVSDHHSRETHIQSLQALFDRTVRAD